MFDIGPNLCNKQFDNDIEDVCDYIYSEEFKEIALKIIIHLDRLNFFAQKMVLLI